MKLLIMEPSPATSYFYLSPSVPLCNIRNTKATLLFWDRRWVASTGSVLISVAPRTDEKHLCWQDQSARNSGRCDPQSFPAASSTNRQDSDFRVFLGLHIYP